MKTKEPYISDLSRSLSKIVWKFGPDCLDGECCNSLTLPEFIVLAKVADTRDCSVQEAGHPLGFTKSGATRIVSRLEKKGFVEKVRFGADTRICCVKINPKGKKTLQLVSNYYEQEFKELAEKMPCHSLNDAVKLITAMAEQIQ